MFINVVVVVGSPLFANFSELSDFSLGACDEIDEVEKDDDEDEEEDEEEEEDDDENDEVAFMGSKPISLLIENLSDLLLFGATGSFKSNDFLRFS